MAFAIINIVRLHHGVVLRVAKGIRTALVLFVAPRESLIGSYMKLVGPAIHFDTFLNNFHIGSSN